ncbi:MAG: peptidoglycan bridge formation glycyltransferase FemA/FemB family protein, partial [Erysipelotrichaceae bacterium]|nr:peptidoglycan bridge formation glycyltransferase FemA/FemB family protein [Erysipelotrichaceae bacterium]
MKLYETDANNFNDFSSAEPDASIFQTSYWSDYMVSKGYKASFIEASNEHDTCLALSSLLLKKESFLSSKYTALAPHGFLINYYDEELFKTFHGLMADYLKQE